MNQGLVHRLLLALLSSGLAVSAALSPEQREQLPPAAPHPVDFAKQVKPILETSCINCHGRGKNKGAFALDTRETLLRGGDSGPAVVPGNSGESYLIELVSGLDPDNVMPQKGSKLSGEQVGLLRAWIDQGLPWEENFSFGRREPLNLKAPQPKIAAGPEAVHSIHPVDLLLKPYDREHKLSSGQRVSDRVFARRVYLDVIGLLPKPEELEEFIADDRGDKRERLVHRLLADHPGYAQHWLTFWNDLLRNDYKGTGYIDEGRKQITDWLYSALADNLPFDRFVAQLINPTAESEGFVKGIIWRGVVNASQTPEMQAAQNISQVFMGVNLKCASCHDSFINDWSLADAYGLASIYADKELEMVQCDKPTGKVALMKFLYPELGEIDPAAPRPERLKKLAEMMTGEQNGRLTRTIVNRLWAKLMGSGLVEPLDDMEQPSWNPDLLDWLAADLAKNGYDLKKTIARILTSQAYQLESVPASELTANDKTFRGPLVRRFSAEQFQDAVSAITGVWHAMPASTQTDFSAGRPYPALSEFEAPAPLRWIWSSAGAADKASPGTVYFRKTIRAPEQPSQASAVIACDNSFKLYLNGQEIASGQDHNKPTVVNLQPHLRPGENVIAIRAVNRPAAPDDKGVDQANPAGLLCYVRIRSENVERGIPVASIWDAASNGSWVWSANPVDDWEQPEFAATDWQPAAELGRVEMGPWKLQRKFAQAVSAAALAGRVRASLVASDPLMTALERPNREQVMTSRASAATTLQALEMTNGKTLAGQLKRGAENLMAEARTSSIQLVTELFQYALTRPPTADELDLGVQLVGAPARKEGLQDLLWGMAMLPEFQLIY